MVSRMYGGVDEGEGDVKRFWGAEDLCPVSAEEAGYAVTITQLKSLLVGQWADLAGTEL